MNNRLYNERRHPRLKIDVPVHILHNRRRIDAYSYDISSNGISLYSDKPLKLFAIYQITLKLPDTHSQVANKNDIKYTNLSFEMAVVRCEKSPDRQHGYKVSLFIYYMREEDRKFLDHYIKERLGKINNGHMDNIKPNLDTPKSFITKKPIFHNYNFPNRKVQKTG